MIKKMVRADFGIINFWWCDDHGAILTAYALQKFLEKEGYSSELLKCSRGYDEKKREGGISQAFEKQFLKSSTAIYKTYDDIYGLSNNTNLNESYIGFITGSDQVFRLEYVPDSWFLTFVKRKGKIAVAASFGTNSFVCEDIERLKKISESLKNFDYISVREDDGVKICRDIFSVDSYHLLDPVFLIERKYYESIIMQSKVKKKGEYIFCYIRDINVNITKMIEKIQKQYHYELVFCTNTMLVEDFLYYILNCKYIITDSYHGLCFSIIFNKDYLCIKNIKRGKSRFDSLKRQLGLPEENFVNDLEQINRIPTIDYNGINQKLEMLCENSKFWLSNALADTYNKYNN